MVEGLIEMGQNGCTVEQLRDMTANEIRGTSQ